MKDNRDLAFGWLAKGESDLSAANWMLGGEGPFDTACFHAQQAIEKALKAMLAFYSQPIPRSHDLDELQRLCLVVYSSSELAALDLTEATDFAVSLRYDIEFWPEKSTAEKAILLATRVLEIIRAVMGVAKHEESSEQR
jgi:HEPN domain-containing protein